MNWALAPEGSFQQAGKLESNERVRRVEKGSEFRADEHGRFGAAEKAETGNQARGQPGLRLRTIAVCPRKKDGPPMPDVCSNSLGVES